MIFYADPPYAHIDFVDKHGTTGYYSSNITSAEAELVKEILIAKGMKLENNRQTKQENNEFTIKVASIESKEEIF